MRIIAHCAADAAYPSPGGRKDKAAMYDLGFRRYASCICVCALLLSSCNGSSIPNAGDNATVGLQALKNHKVFAYTGTKQTFIVPTGVTRLAVSAHGGSGAGAGYTHCVAFAGYPGRMYAVIAVRPGDKLSVFVGGAGKGGVGGFNGGGFGGANGYGTYRKGWGGGGASDVRIGGDTLKDRIVVAAGGGGAGDGPWDCLFDWGGNGGGMAGKPGCCGQTSGDGNGAGGSGGTQTDGGSGGSGGQGSNENGDPGDNGALGLGGDGGNGSSYTSRNFGGGGGGGYYGGGGGGGGAFINISGEGCDYGCAGGGGGGGSSYVEPSAIKSQTWTGWREHGSGRVVFSWN
jgi:hypothetical protein